MPSDRRDDFTTSVIRTLAARVGHVCSCPGCPNPTFGPHTDPEKSVKLGKAAHITAAAPGGPRYDKTLTSAQRKSATNGIWLCSHHADLIDKDESTHTVELLREWKQAAEEMARSETYGNPRKAIRRVVFELTEEDREFFRSLALSPDETPEQVLPRMVAAAQLDIEGFVNNREPTVHTVSLDLTLLEGGRDLATNLASVANGITVSGAVALVAPPGTGKTTTLIQLVATILERGDRVAAFLPLAEWASVGGTWFETLVRRNAFRSFKPEHFMQMAYEGQLVLLLDGWNELDSQSSRKAHQHLADLQRDYPQLAVALGTRQQAHSSDAIRVRVEPLKKEQQLELARKYRGGDGKRLMEQAWRTAGLRELVAIPLYLKALLMGVQGDTLPDTKDAVLASFVRQHESAPERAILLRSQLSGQHKEILGELASVANVEATTSLSQRQSFRAASAAVGRLQEDGQLGTAPQPAAIIDCLVDSHLLVRSGPEGSVAFQHQQFQEWYASFRVEHAMVAAAEGDATSRKELRETILDRTPWEESILFACERLSRQDARGTAAVAQAIVECLAIDPMLGANMIRRGAPEVWIAVRDRVMAFVAKWHKPGEVDRALRFMILTGRSEFAGRVWPFLESADPQVLFEVLRVVEPFRSSVLGPDAVGRLSALPDPQRRIAVSELAYRGDSDGVELAVNVAKGEKNVEMVVEILEALHFQGADVHVTEILAKATDDVWKELADTNGIRGLADAGQAARLSELRRPALEAVENPIRRARLLLEKFPEHGEVERQLGEILTAESLPTDRKAGDLVQDVSHRFPKLAISAMLSRLNRGFALPVGTEGILSQAPVVDAGPVADLAVNPVGEHPNTKAVRRVIGPNTVGKLIDQLLQVAARIRVQPLDQAVNDRYHAIEEAIRATRQESFVVALLERADTTDTHDISILSSLVHVHGEVARKAPAALSPELRARLVATLVHWGKLLLAAADATRHEMARLVYAIGTLPTPELVPLLERMLERDLDEEANERAEVRRGGGGGVRMSYRNWYGIAFAAIGDAQAVGILTDKLSDLAFGQEAARALYRIWSQPESGKEPHRQSGWYDYSGVRGRREQARTAPLTSSPLADRIWEVVRSCGKHTESTERQRHAVALASIAMRMPLGVHRPEVADVLSLPLPFWDKRELFVVTAMAGIELSADALVATVRELLEAARTEHWRLDESSGELMTWMELFAFSDRPVALRDCLNGLPPEHRYPHRLRRVVEALGYSPHPDALAVLKTLAEHGPRPDRDDWLAALVVMGGADAGRALVDAVCDGPVKGQRRTPRHNVADLLATCAKADPFVRAQLIERYRAAEDQGVRAVLQEALLELGTEEAVLTVIQGMAQRGEGLGYELAEAVKELAIREYPSDEWANAIERVSAPLTGFRKALFSLLSDPKQSMLARGCLEQIDLVRDEYGRLPDEPRHPDIAIGTPWPIV